MPVIERPKEESVVNCLNISLLYTISAYPKGLKTTVVQKIVQDCRDTHKYYGKLVQKSNKERTRLNIWLEICLENDAFVCSVIDRIKKECTYDELKTQYMQFDFAKYQLLNNIILCKVPKREDGIYISGEEPVQSSCFDINYLEIVKQNNILKRKLMDDYSSDNMKSLLSDSSENEHSVLREMHGYGKCLIYCKIFLLTRFSLSELPFNKKMKRGMLLFLLFL